MAIMLIAVFLAPHFVPEQKDDFDNRINDFLIDNRDT